MDSLARIEKLAARTAFEPQLMPELLAAVSSATNARMTTFEVYHRPANHLAMILTDRPDVMASNRRRLEDHYASVNPRYPITHEIPHGEVFSDDALGDDRTLLGLEFYADFLAPDDFLYFGGATLTEDGGRQSLFSVQRAPSQGRLDRHELEHLGEIRDRLADMAALYLDVVLAPTASHFAQVLDRMHDPMTILAPDGSILFANSTMETLLSSDPCVADSSHLHFRQETLQRALGTVMQGIASGRQTAREVVARTHGGATIMRAIRLSRDRARELDLVAPDPICVIVDGYARLPGIAAARIRHEFDLTAREAEVGLALSEGRDIAGIAQWLAISRNTVKTHISSLHDKLGVSTTLAAAARIHTTLDLHR